ncbi:MAG: hypothetical protein N3B16_01820 [Candidatus Aminicenantes bacterium]|nr:hypothetical protein [Candidatus Aminicenantes bacterium]
MGGAKELLSKRSIFRTNPMIFVTVGTHEQQFNRLIENVDCLREMNRIKENVFIQIGYSSYEPKYCEYSRFLKFEEVMSFISRARIVITHAGPGSIFPILYFGKIPIVVPRQKKFGEHVDDHQVYFCRRMERMNKIIAIYNIENLEHAIINYNQLVESLGSEKKCKEINSIKNYIKALEQICDRLFQKGKPKLMGNTKRLNK